MAYSNTVGQTVLNVQTFIDHGARRCGKLAEETYRVAKDNATMWVGLVLDMGNDFQPQGYNPKDPDKSHINIRPKEWWDDIMTSAGWKINKEFDDKFRATRVKKDGYSFFKNYGWHSICYRR